VPARPLVLVVALAVAVTSACGGGGDSACADEVRERLDPNSAQHLLPGAAPPAYTTDPPTSGAHQLGNWPTGVLDEPIDAPVQVALLEGGEVLLQYRPRALGAAARDDLERLANRLPNVTVAPNGDLPAPVVATAWTYKQTCGAVDVDALRGFVRAHAGKGA
jgi:hypothetical protein